jgi:hypothetical protein
MVKGAEGNIQVDVSIGIGRSKASKVAAGNNIGVRRIAGFHLLRLQNKRSLDQSVVARDCREFKLWMFCHLPLRSLYLAHLRGSRLIAYLRRTHRDGFVSFNSVALPVEQFHTAPGTLHEYAVQAIPPGCWGKIV